MGSRCLLSLLVVCASIGAAAKDASNAAIVLFDGAQGASYIQITGMTLNGKTDVRLCDSVAKFSKNAYNALPRTSLQQASSMQRGADGVLTLTVNEKQHCVVPFGIKFDKIAELTPADAADEALIQGTPITPLSSDSPLPAFKPGMQIVFVAAPDVELAEFLRAQRANTIRQWQDFVAHYASSTRLAAARNAMAGLHERAAESTFADYQKGRGGNPDLGLLRRAVVEAQAANQCAPPYRPALDLIGAVGQELDRLLQPDRAGLQAFQKALQHQSAGYSQLSAARLHVAQLLEVRPNYVPVVELSQQIFLEERKLEAAVARAESLISSARYDDAVNALGVYKCFALEIPRMGAVINAAYKHHFDEGQNLLAQERWEQSEAEFRQALTIRPESDEANAALNRAAAQLSAQRDQQEANLALLSSNEYASKGQVIEAYDVLADLPEREHALVASQMVALARNYLSAAMKRAQRVQEVDVPIRTRADEDAVREACLLLSRAGSLSDDPSIALRHDFLSSKISSYYLDQAGRYLQRPQGAGAGIGWLYLQEAQRYGITNQNSVKDQMVRYGPLYQRQGRISIGLTLRDQTSRQDNPGFADQLTDAITNALESSGLSIDVVRRPADLPDAMQPNLMLVGEILEHRVAKNATLEAPPSKYRAGTHDARNPAWIQVKSDYDSAQQQLATAQNALADLQTQHKKKEKEIADAQDAVQRAQRRVDELQHKLEITEQNNVVTVIEPYHYTRKTFDLSASVQLVFRLSDRSGRNIGPPMDVRKEKHTSVVILQDVKPEDTEGITNQGVEPDASQFLSDLEIEARNSIVDSIREQAMELPARVLQQARNFAQYGDLDGAAEQYIVFLNSTPGTAAHERDEASKFLRDRFNLTVPAAVDCKDCGHLSAASPVSN